jgi:hypothetical protein
MARLMLVTKCYGPLPSEPALIRISPGFINFRADIQRVICLMLL